MPMYEYKCKNCGIETELLMKISDPHPKSCEHCNEGPMEKLLSRTHFVLKGTGWYETDFKGKNASKSESSSTISPRSTDKKDSNMEGNNSDSSVSSKDTPTSTSSSSSSCSGGACSSAHAH